MPLELPSPAGLSLRTIGLVLAAVATLAVAVMGLGALGFSFDPFDLQGRKLDRALAGQATAKAEGAAAAIEAAGSRDTTTRVEVALNQRSAAQERLTELSAATRSAPDANEPIDPDRIDRLRDFDQQLCAIRPAICAGASDPAAATPDAGNGPAALPTGRTPAG